MCKLTRLPALASRPYSEKKKQGDPFCAGVAQHLRVAGYKATNCQLQLRTPLLMLLLSLLLLSLSPTLPWAVALPVRAGEALARLQKQNVRQYESCEYLCRTTRSARNERPDPSNYSTTNSRIQSVHLHTHTHTNTSKLTVHN